MDYIDQLIKNCKKAKKSKPIKKFVFNGDLTELKDIETAIYIIEELNGNPEQTFIDMLVYKKTKERACPALKSPSKVMYVGSSTTGVMKRIEQHIGKEKGKGTYALHLKHWFNGDYSITIKQYEETREIIQIIEDALSEKLNPAFGKKGGNNK